MEIRSGMKDTPTRTALDAATWRSSTGTLGGVSRDGRGAAGGRPPAWMSAGDLATLVRSVV